PRRQPGRVQCLVHLQHAAIRDGATQSRAPEGSRRTSDLARPLRRSGNALMPAALALLAHPDDAEFLCAGTLYRLRSEKGWAIHIATMTPGDCGSTEHPPEEIAKIRRGEGSSAAKILGAAYSCLEERDLRVIYSEAALEKVVEFIRRVRPDIVLTHSPDDY